MCLFLIYYTLLRNNDRHSRLERVNGRELSLRTELDSDYQAISMELRDGKTWILMD